MVHIEHVRRVACSGIPLVIHYVICDGGDITMLAARWHIPQRTQNEQKTMSISMTSLLADWPQMAKIVDKPRIDVAACRMHDGER